MRPTLRHLLTGIALVAATAAPDALGAQSVLRRTPNLDTGWLAPPGTVHFNFLHRFHLAGGDNNIVVNTPTFLLTAPLPGRTFLGARYASNSLVSGSEQNELELFGRWSPVRLQDGAPAELTLTAAYNEAARSADGELSVRLPLGPHRLLGVGRMLSDAYGDGDTGWAVGGGAVVRLTDRIALAGDVLSSTDRPDGGTVAWGAGIQLHVPLTPHTLSLQATNTRTATLQGSSLGREEPDTGDDRILWGFEFTIPFTLSRYFGGGGPDRGRGEAATPAGVEAAAVVRTTTQLRFNPSTIRIRAGESVRWENPSRVVHTVTADPARAAEAESVSLPGGAENFHSGDLAPGETYTRTFEVPGEYVYFCVPHEGAEMIGRIVVEPR